MRPLLEIIDSAKDGNKPTHDECYFAMLVLDALSNFTIRDLRDLGFGAERVKALGARLLAEGDHKRWKRALNLSPDTYLGPGNTPGTPEQQTRRRVSKAIWKKVADGSWT